MIVVEMEAKVRRRAVLAALGSAVVLLVLNYLGSQGFQGMKLTEAGYVIATYLFVAGSAYRLVQWGHRPGARMYLRGALRRLMFDKTGAKAGAQTLGANLAAQRFILKRGSRRWLAHMAISWGCMLSFLLTFPLVLGWLKFKFVEPMSYTVYVMGFPTISFKLGGLLAELFFNGLNLSATLMIIGLILAYANRALARRNYPEARAEWDMAPLHALMLVGLTGLAITVDYKFFGGRTYLFWAIAHQLTVVGLLVWFPFSKLFHFEIRPVAVVVQAYHQSEAARLQRCVACERAYAPAQQVADLTAELDVTLLDHCPDCKRRIRARRYLTKEVMEICTQVSTR